jgi:hypothetical protein
MKVHRKIYYVPGMITLLVLPILCYYYLLPFKKEERALEIVFAAKYYPHDRFTIRFDTSFLSKPRYKRNYLDITLNGNETEDKIKLDFFRLRIREMISTKDTRNGVHLIFGDSTKYGTFVESFNICKKEGLLRYAPYDNNLWTFQMDEDKDEVERIKKRRKEIEDQNRLDLINSKADKLTFGDKLSAALKVWPIFLILIILSFFSLRKVITKKTGVQDSITR